MANMPNIIQQLRNFCLKAVNEKWIFHGITFSNMMFQFGVHLEGNYIHSDLGCIWDRRNGPGSSVNKWL